MRRVRTGFFVAAALAMLLGLAGARPAQAVHCEIVEVPDYACIFCHRWVQTGDQTCDLWQGLCTDGWYGGGWYCW